MIENIRISEKGKQQLIQLKRKTGIENWNVLCRWALCLSLAEKSVPPFEKQEEWSNVEMTWKTFAGEQSALYEALVNQRLNADSSESSLASTWFSIHLHRGISYLVRRCNSLSDLISLIQNNPHSRAAKD